MKKDEKKSGSFATRTDLAGFELIRRHGALASAVHCAFDLLELDGRDLRREPIEERKRLLGKLMRGSTFEEDGAICIPRGVQARLRGDRVEAAWLALPLGHSAHWVKVKNPKAPAVTREAEEDWS